MKKLLRFLASVRKEIPKIKWPTKKEMIRNATATLIVVLILVVFFGALDIILTALKLGLK